MRAVRGFSLLEVLVVLALMAAAGSLLMHSQQAAQQVTQARQLLPVVVQALLTVRLRAASEQRAWRICSRAPDGTCQLPWQGGWQAFPVLQAETPPLLLPDLPAGWHLQWRSFRRQAWLDWQASGDAADSNGTLTLCPPIPQDAALRQIVVSRSGRLRTQLPHRLSAQGLAAARQACGWR